MNKIRFFIPLLIIIPLSLFSTFYASAEPLLSASLIAEADEFTVGDPIQLTLSITHPPGHQVILPGFDHNWGDFIVRSQSAGSTVSNPDGTETTTQLIETSLFAPGTFNTPSLSISVSDGQGQLSEVIVDPILLTISSVLLEGDTELRDIKPQAALPYRNLLPWLIGGALLALGLTVGFIWLRRRKTKHALGFIDHRLPHEVALDELYRVESLDLPFSGRFKEHYTLVSDCLRVYIEKTYQIPVLERTTGEIKGNMKRSSIPHEVAKQFVSLLDESDLVKFSKFTPEVKNAHDLLIQGREIVERTKPVDNKSGEDQEASLPHIPPNPRFGKDSHNPQAEVTA